MISGVSCIRMEMGGGVSKGTGSGHKVWDFSLSQSCETEFRCWFSLSSSVFSGCGPDKRHQSHSVERWILIKHELHGDEKRNDECISTTVKSTEDDVCERDVSWGVFRAASLGKVNGCFLEWKSILQNALLWKVIKRGTNESLSKSSRCFIGMPFVLQYCQSIWKQNMITTSK